MRLQLQQRAMHNRGASVDEQIQTQNEAVAVELLGAGTTRAAVVSLLEHRESMASLDPQCLAPKLASARAFLSGKCNDETNVRPRVCEHGRHASCHQFQKHPKMFERLLNLFRTKQCVLADSPRCAGVQLNRASSLNKMCAAAACATRAQRSNADFAASCAVLAELCAAANSSTGTGLATEAKATVMGLVSEGALVDLFCEADAAAVHAVFRALHTHMGWSPQQAGKALLGMRPEFWLPEDAWRALLRTSGQHIEAMGVLLRRAPVSAAASSAQLIRLACAALSDCKCMRAPTAPPSGFLSTHLLQGVRLGRQPAGTTHPAALPPVGHQYCCDSCSPGFGVSKKHPAATQSGCHAVAELWPRCG